MGQATFIVGRPGQSKRNTPPRHPPARRRNPDPQSSPGYFARVLASPRTSAYMAVVMDIALLLALFIATVAGMEGFAYVVHRWVMHGPGWFLHRSHHRARTGNWELNDLYFVVFAAPSILLLLGGVQWDWGGPAIAVGAGIAAYGAIYLGFHDIIVHRRLAHRYVPRSNYMKRIMQAHRIHHIVETREGTVSFGFLVAPRPEELKAQLGAMDVGRVRMPRGRLDA